MFESNECDQVRVGVKHVTAEVRDAGTTRALSSTCDDDRVRGLYALHPRWTPLTGEGWNADVDEQLSLAAVNQW